MSLLKSDRVVNGSQLPGLKSDKNIVEENIYIYI